MKKVPEMIANGKKIYFRFLVEFFLILLSLTLFSIFTIIGKRPFVNNGIRGAREVKILDTSGIEETDDGYCYTNNEDPQLIVNYDGGCILNITLLFNDEADSQGRIYYAGGDKYFSNENSKEFEFKSGQNIIRIDDKEVKFLRLDIADRKGCKFKVISIYEENAILFRIKNLNYMAIILISIGLTVLYEGLKRVQDDSPKIRYFFFVILCVSLICVFGQFILGRGYYIYTDIGSDTFFQYYPYYVNVVRSIKNGTFSVWSWNYGLGMSILNTVSWIMDPFGMGIILCGIIFGAGSIHYALVWMQILKIAIAYWLCKRYLKMFCQNEFAVCMGAYLYAFNGYLLLWGQHYFFGTNCIFILLILIAIEKFIHSKGEKGGLQIALTITWLLLYSYYAGYMILIAAAGYFIYRSMAEHKEFSVRKMIKMWGKCSYAAVSGILLSGMVFIPSCYYILTNSSRLNGASRELPDKIAGAFGISFDINNIGSRLSRLMSNNLLCINDNSNLCGYFSNYYELPQLFCTIFIFFFAGQWIIYEIKKAKKESKWIAFGIKVFLLYLVLFNEVSGLVLNAFAYASYRYTFIIFPIVSLGITFLWERVFCYHKIDILGIIIGMFLSVFAWIYSYKNMSADVSGYVTGVAFLLILGYAVILLMKKNIKYPQMVCFFAVLLISTTILDSYITTNQRGYVKNEDYPLSWENGQLINDTAAAINWLKEYDNSFYRIEKTYGDWNVLADSFFEQYSTPTCYNSTPNVNVADFYDNIYNISGTKAAQYFDLNSELALEANGLLNIKYILSKSPLDDFGWCNLVSKQGDVYIYRNTMTDSVAKWYGDVISKEDFNKLDDESKASALKAAVVVGEQMELDKNATAMIEKFLLKEQTELTGRVKCTGKGILMLAIPNQEGWTVYVDGTETEQYNTDFGFIGIILDKGVHTVSAEYSIPKKNLGIVVSIIGFFMCICLGIFEKGFMGQR